MHKFWAVFIFCCLVLNLCACGSDAQTYDDQVITRSMEEATASSEAEPTEVVEETAEAEKETVQINFAMFEYNGQTIRVGEKLDMTLLPRPKSIYEVPSCAFEGTDNVYRYEDFEITAYDDGTGEVIYSIYLLTPTVTTPEGLGLGEDLSKMLELYGENYEQDGTTYYYYCGDVMLSILVQNETVISVEYRWITE